MLWRLILVLFDLKSELKLLIKEVVKLRQEIVDLREDLKPKQLSDIKWHFESPVEE